jgi:hypothetical protein
MGSILQLLSLFSLLLACLLACPHGTYIGTPVIIPSGKFHLSLKITTKIWMLQIEVEELDDLHIQYHNKKYNRLEELLYYNVEMGEK